MEARPVDPRGIERAVHDPTYRVVLWEQGPPPPEGDAPAGFRADEYDVTGAADVEEVMAWATRRASGRLVTISVLVDGSAVRILGEDPTRGP